MAGPSARAAAVPTLSRRRLALLAAALVPIGIGTKLYGGPGSTWVVGNLGGAVYVAFWSLAVLALRPRLPVRRVAVSVLGCTCALELLQLWHPRALEAVRRTLAGQALLGSHFAWADFPYYVAGAVGAVLLCRLARRVDDPGRFARTVDGT